MLKKGEHIKGILSELQVLLDKDKQANASSIFKRIKFLSEIEFENGTKEINIEFVSVDFELASLSFWGGVVMDPSDFFNQNHHRFK